jgi:hypothetical protein
MVMLGTAPCQSGRPGPLDQVHENFALKNGSYHRLGAPVLHKPQASGCLARRDWAAFAAGYDALMPDPWERSQAGACR